MNGWTTWLWHLTPSSNFSTGVYRAYIICAVSLKFLHPFCFWVVLHWVSILTSWLWLGTNWIEQFQLRTVFPAQCLCISLYNSYIECKHERNTIYSWHLANVQRSRSSAYFQRWFPPRRVRNNIFRVTDWNASSIYLLTQFWTYLIEHNFRPVGLELQEFLPCGWIEKSWKY